MKDPKLKKAIKELKKEIVNSEKAILVLRKRLNETVDVNGYVVKVNNNYGVHVDSKGNGTLCRPTDVSIFTKEIADITANEIPLKNEKGDKIRPVGVIASKDYFLQYIEFMQKMVDFAKEQLKVIGES